MMMASKVKKEKSKTPGLVDHVFSWSISDVINKNYFSNKVKEIPETFTCMDDYLKSFINPLLEETRADLCSNLTTLPRAPICEVFDVKMAKNFKPPKDLYYTISLKQTSENERKEGVYEPEFGDLIAFTDVRPKSIDDLNRPKMEYVLAIIQGLKDEGSIKLPILASKPIEFKKKVPEKGKSGGKLFAVYLTNLTTNIRIWKALNPDQGVANMNIIKSALQADSNVGLTCTACSTKKAKRPHQSYQNAAIQDFGLDESQQTAVLSCIATKDCYHQNTVKLIWGPPGTGKTKTVASLLFSLFQMKCRSLTCAPTNVAVIGVINRLMNLLSPTLKYGTYGLGDIVLFGNGERMKIDDNEELFDVFLDYRVSSLSECLAPLSGYRACVAAMIRLLEEPKEQYQLYLNKDREQVEKADDKSESGEEDEAENAGLKGSKHKYLRKVISQTMKENKKKKGKERAESQKWTQKKEGKDSTGSKKAQKDLSKGVENISTFEEFFMKEFVSIGMRLKFCIISLYTHMPTSVIQVELAGHMARVVDMLQALRTSFQSVAANRGLREALYGIESPEGRKRSLLELQQARRECLLKLKLIQEQVCLPNMYEYYQIKSFCLKNAILIFCTVSSSSKLHTEGMEPIQLLIIDEAAQLKECESTIPLQLAGLRHAILIGDEKQLPAMVQSKMSEKAGFGRSLFQRLVKLGHPKHLLNVQYRMHPSISLFPNREFYKRQIKDGPNVRDPGYKKSFLEGPMFGSYSFIDINHGKELASDTHSKTNPVEVYVVAEIIANLHKQFLLSGQKVRVGCISPYKAQVFALEEKLGKTYSTDANSDFSVNVRSVDGFQGGEEDIIIISTVRCNGNGSIGFLSDHQRTNVAITRARHCLWILGNSATLLNSHSVWKKLVLDAKNRGCFHNAGDDKNLCAAISCALIDGGQFDKLLNSESVLFKNARWKVCFRDEFAKSFSRIKDSGIRREVISLLVKLSNGWRQHPERHTSSIENEGISACLLELYKVKDPLKLMWNTDIHRENSREIQVIKVWGILPGSEIPKMARITEEVLGKYTMNTISRCRHRKMKGDLVVPASWPAETSGEAASDDGIGSLVGKFATLCVKDEAKSSSPKIWRKKEGKKKKK